MNVSSVYIASFLSAFINVRLIRFHELKRVLQVFEVLDYGIEASPGASKLFKACNPMLQAAYLI